ncbi:MAG: UDP-3-O-(3-hydroxymyristoyl)glucosamine N-acyltransferase [Candidatus Cloacimonetes bacterium]|nr:UDP-3-O-(3-hydroxymyristoyl)glucosamine N-acyltransferase [Candidatus Cloacimonadota bacterium]
MKSQSKLISLAEIIERIDCEVTIKGNCENVWIKHVKPCFEEDRDSLIWIHPANPDKLNLAMNTIARIVVCDDTMDIAEARLTDKVIIQVKNPKLLCLKIVKWFFTEPQVYGIHPTAIIHPEAIIGENVYIGPLSVIGRVTIDEDTVISGNVQICDNVRIGKNVYIQGGCIIGSEGVNITKDESGVWHQFPHIGGVLIEDNVRIDALCDIGRGTLGDTIIGSGTKLDVGCYVAHNAKLGRDNVIIGHSMICGSVIVGNGCWFGANTVIIDRISIGNNVFTGMGSVVVASQPDNARVMGNPARPIDEMKLILKRLKSLV